MFCVFVWSQYIVCYTYYIVRIRTGVRPCEIQVMPVAHNSRASSMYHVVMHLPMCGESEGEKCVGNWGALLVVRVGVFEFNRGSMLISNVQKFNYLVFVFRCTQFR